VNQKNDFKKYLFGAVKKREAKGGYHLNPKMLMAPFEGETSIAKYFCTGCGILTEVNETGAKVLAAQAGFSNLEKFNNIYFEVLRCPLCDEDFKDAKLKPII